MSEAPKWNWHGGIPIAILSLGAGAFVWVASSQLFGEREPWDAPGRLYVGYLLGAGFIAGAIAPRWFWATLPGIYVGQCAGAIFTTPEPGPLAPLGLLCFLPAFSLVSLAGAGVGAAVGALLRIIIAQLGRPP